MLGLYNDIAALAGQGTVAVRRDWLDPGNKEFQVKPSDLTMAVGSGAMPTLTTAEAVLGDCSYHFCFEAFPLLL